MVSIPAVEITSTNEVWNSNNVLLGYAPRYYDYKTSYDQVHGAFLEQTEANSFGTWVAPFDDSYIEKFASSVIGATGLVSSFFKVNPAVLNPIFTNQITDGSDMSKEQLMINSSFEIRSVRNLDYNGLPY